MKTAKVYWIRRKEHSDIMTEGYVGYTTKTIYERFEEHKKEPANRHLKFALEKYDDIIIEEVFVDEVSKCQQEENRLRPKPDIGWNLKTGGKGGNFSEETKKKQSEKAKRGYENGRINPQKGKKREDLRQRNLSDSNPFKGRNQSGSNNPMFGKTFSEEHRRKISEANSNVPKPEGFGNKISEIRKSTKWCYNVLTGKQIQIHKDSLPPEGFVLGRKKSNK